ncbi:MAG: hypothetical protein ABR543_01560 [Gemmatimonadaceae bacterium]
MSRKLMLLAVTLATAALAACTNPTGPTEKLPVPHADGVYGGSGT